MWKGWAAELWRRGQRAQRAGRTSPQAPARKHAAGWNQEGERGRTGTVQPSLRCSAIFVHFAFSCGYTVVQNINALGKITREPM